MVSFPQENYLAIAYGAQGKKNVGTLYFFFYKIASNCLA